MEARSTAHRAGRFRPAEEQEVAERIAAAESDALRAIAGIREAEAALGRGVTRVYRTRAADVERLEEAIEAAGRVAERRPALRRRVERAREAWNRAQDLRWRLAMSAAHVVAPEARKVAAASRVDVEDLVNEGYIGLLRAATRFDPRRGVRFPTYARWWARAQMTRAVDQGGRDIRLSGGAVEQMRNLRRVQARYEQQQKPWMIEDLSRETGYTPDRVRELLSQATVVSIDAPVDEDGDADDRRLADVLPGSAPVAEERTLDAQAMTVVTRALRDLGDERLRTVLVERFGLQGHAPRTLKEIGAEMGLSRERVRQLELEALHKLRAACGLGLPSPESREAA